MMSADEASPRSVALVIAMAMFIGILEGTVIATALPYMAADFRVRPVDLSIGISAYLLVTAIFLPISGWVAERFGTRRVFTASMLGFAGASLLCGLSTTLTGFVAVRALQALFASLMVPVGNLVLLKVTPKRDLIAIMAISTTPALIAPVIGPPLGGFITAFLGWRWNFFMIPPLAIAGAALALRVIPDLRAERVHRFDLGGFLLTGGSLALLLYGFDRLSAHPDRWYWAAPFVAAGLVGGAIAVLHARRTPTPLVPLTALRHATFATISFGAGFLARIPFMAQAFVLPLFFQLGFCLDAFHTGILLLAQNAGDLVLKPVAGKALRWRGFRTALTSGTLTMTLSIVACAFLTADMPLWAMAGALFAVGMARSVLFTAMMSLNFADVAEEEMSGATVLNNLANSLTAAVAISLAALMLNLGTAWHVDQLWALGEFRIPMLVLAAVGAPAVLLFARLPRNAGAEVSGHRLGALSLVVE